MSEKLTEKSLIPISFVITLLTLAFYLGQTSNDIKANTAQIQSIKSEQSELSQKINGMKETLIRVDANLKFLIESQTKKN